MAFNMFFQLSKYLRGPIERDAVRLALSQPVSVTAHWSQMIFHHSTSCSLTNNFGLLLKFLVIYFAIILMALINCVGGHTMCRNCCSQGSISPILLHGYRTSRPVTRYNKDKWTKGEIAGAVTPLSVLKNIIDAMRCTSTSRTAQPFQEAIYCMENELQGDDRFLSSEWSSATVWKVFLRQFQFMGFVENGTTQSFLNNYFKHNTYHT